MHISHSCFLLIFPVSDKSRQGILHNRKEMAATQTAISLDKDLYMILPDILSLFYNALSPRSPVRILTTSCTS